MLLLATTQMRPEPIVENPSSDMNEVILECKDLTYAYSTSNVTLQNINLKTFKDELVAVSVVAMYQR